MTDKRDNNPSHVIVGPDVSATLMAQTPIASRVGGLWAKSDDCDGMAFRRLLQATLLGLTIAFMPGPGFTAPLSLRQFAGLAQRCAPTVSLRVLRAVARTESQFDPLALHDNNQSISRRLPSVAAAVALAQRWLAIGDSVDVGLMQINAANLPSLRLSLKTAFDPCRSLSAAASILRAAYVRSANVAEQQAALLIALSRYNTGRPLAGLINGYVGKVLTAHHGAGVFARPSPSAQTASNTLPAWNVWANAAYAQVHGASWLVASPHDQPRVVTDSVLPVDASPAEPVLSSRDVRRFP